MHIGVKKNMYCRSVLESRRAVERGSGIITTGECGA
jgi:hypothetical protein